MKIAFFGTPLFAVPSLEALVEAGEQVVTVVTQPDRRRGRGQRVQPSPVKTIATRLAIPVLQPDRARDPAFVAALSAAAPELSVVAAYGKILPDEVLGAANHGTINVHASLLPKYRGAAPIHRAVIAGETETGITMIRLVTEMDAGPMLGRAVRAIGPDETSEEVERALAVLGARLLVSTVRKLARGAATEEPQDHRLATFAPKVTKADGIIDWARPAADIHNLVRGLFPWPHAYTFLGSTRLLLFRTSVESAAPAVAGPPGAILLAERDQLHVCCGQGTVLAIHELQPEGRKRLDTRAFLAGRPVTLPATLTASGPE